MRFEINIEPVAWQRVKRTRTGHVYVPKKTRDFKIALAWHVRQQMIQQNLHAFENGLAVSFEFYCSRPKKPEYEFPTKQDLDNFMKAATDALNGVLWTDDRLIRGLSGSKHFCEKVGDTPHIIIQACEQ